MCVSVCMHVFAQEKEGCIVCFYNPDGLRLPVIGFCQGMMSHDKHTHSCSPRPRRLQLSTLQTSERLLKLIFTQA